MEVSLLEPEPEKRLQDRVHHGWRTSHVGLGASGHAAAKGSFENLVGKAGLTLPSVIRERFREGGQQAELGQT